jgi:hypothetical protein
MTAPGTQNPGAAFCPVEIRRKLDKPVAIPLNEGVALVFSMNQER